MKIICPNLKNKEVAREFEELKNATSEAAAYHIWSQNNGNGIDKAPNGEPSKLFSDLLEHYNGDRVAAIQAKARTYSKSFKEWFGDWTGNVSIDIDSKDAIDYLYSTNTELSKVGSKEEYAQYVNSIYPNSLINSIYWHGTDSDLSQGVENTKKGKGSGAPETGAEMYFNKQPWASLQYISGVNRNIPDTEGYNNWVKLWWELKEALGNGRMDTDEWKNEIIGPNTRQYSPNKRGIFNRDKGGSNGKYLSERKARYGYQDKTDKEFFEEVFDIRYGKETFNDWVNRKKSEFQDVWESRQVKKGMYPAVLNVQNPIVEKNQNTYYEEQRGLFTKAKKDKNDAIVSDEANNEFGSDVVVIFNPKENVHFLGTKQDIENFKNWKSSNKDKTNVSKVVDENGEPKLMFHGSDNVFDTFRNDVAIYTTDAMSTADSYFYSESNVNDRMELFEYNSEFENYGLEREGDYARMEYLLNEYSSLEKPSSEYDNPYSNSPFFNNKFAYKPYKTADDFLHNVFPDFLNHIDNAEYRKEIINAYVEHEHPINPNDFYKRSISGQILPLFVSNKNPLVIDGKGSSWNKIEYNGKIWSTRDLEIFAKNNNYDGLIINNIIDLGGRQSMTSMDYGSATVAISYNPNQVKSIDNQGTFSIQDNNIYNQKIVSRETRLENFYNSYVKLRTKTVEKAENETELRKRRSKLSSNSKLHETNLDAIMQEILGIYIYDADYSTTDSTLRELNNLSESRYLTLLNEEIDKLDRLLIPVDSLITAVNNINKGYNKLSDYSKEVQDRLFNMPVYREATELPVTTRAKSLKQYNAYQKIKYNKELNTFISNLKLTQLKLAARKYHLDTIKMFVEEYDRGFEDMKLKVLDEYLYRTSLLSKKAPKLQGTYNLLEDLAKGQSELDSKNANEQIQKISNVTNIKQALELLSKELPEYAPFIRHLQEIPYYEDILIEIDYNSEDSFALTKAAGNTSFKIDPETNEYTAKITINKESFGYRTLLHEIVHAFSSIALAGRDEHGNNEFVSDIIAIIDHCNKYFEIPKIFGTLMQDSLNYGFTNPQEFIAEFFSNPAFQMLLKEIPAIGETEIKEKNIFKSVVEAITKFFASFFNKEKNLYNQIEPLMYKIIDFQSDLHKNNTIKYNPNREYNSDNYTNNQVITKVISNSKDLNEEVAREFEELKNATSEAAAYHIWSQNNGNGIDKAPNGEPSKLFSDLLEHYNGDRVAAIQAKARTYSKSFKEWFGDWEKAANANRVSLGKEIPNTDKYSKYGQKGETDVEIREVLDEKGTVIGTVRMEFSGKNRKGVVTLHPNLTVTGKGYGTALYQHIADKYNINVEESFGEIGKSEAAKRMWDRIHNAVSRDPDTPLRQLTPSNSSKVVDENGEPLVVYHGSSATFDTFDENYQRRGQFDFGFYFTPNQELAQRYASEGNSLYATYLNLKEEDTIPQTRHDDWVFRDGIIVKRNYEANEQAREIVVRRSNQIKSIDNQGTFSTQDNNIYLADSNTENVSQLESMQSYSNSKELLDNMDSEMATVLNDVASKIGMQPVSIEYTDRPLNEIYPEATYWTPAIYDRNSNTIVVNRNGDFSRYGSLENVLLHEIAHAITLDSLAADTEAANELRAIQKEYAATHEDHASKNVYEFAAELFSNPEVIHNMFDFPATKGEKTLIQKIIDWFKRLFGKNTTHQDLINKIVDNVIEFNAYQTLEQREDSYDYIPDILPAASKREEIASIKLRSVFSDMVKTAENRVASLRYNVIEDKFDRNENLRNDKLLSNLRSIQNSITDVEGVNNITNFLNGSLEYVDNVLYSLDEAERVIKTIDEKISTAQITNDTEELTKLRTALDNFGAEYLYPHESNLRKLYNELNTEFNRNIYENILGTNEFDNILSVVDGLIREFSSKRMIDRENIGYMYGNSVRRTVEKFLRTEMEEAKDPNIDRALMNWLTFDGDLNWYHRFFATPVNSPKFVIKLLRKVVGDVNSMTHKQVYRKYAELYKAAKETRDHNLLFERDVDGKKTGYLIRDRRYGVYQNNKYKFRKDWLKKHKLASIDELKLNPSLWIQYQKDYNDWKSENCERKYTPEFYAIFTNLSMEANMALSEVNLEIDNILKPYRDSSTNKPRFERMPIDEYQKYIRLLEKKRNLANPYNPITGELKPEGSVEAQIAAELTEAYAKLQEGLESKVDMDAFLEEMERMKNIEGYTPDGSDTLYSAWLERNTRWELTDEFKEKVSKQNKKDYGEIYDRLYQARYNLLRLYRTDKFEPDYTRMPQAVKDKIKELDIAMYNVRKRTKKTVGSVRLFKSELSDLAKENGGKSAVSPEDIWVDDKGVKHYASYMTKVIPVRQQYMHRVPNSNWAETSEESKFYNKNYDNSIPEAEQPKLSIKEYDNRKAYNAVMRDPALVNLRNVILDVMNEANDKITHSNYKNNYKLPQINGNIFNYWGNKGLITGTRNYMVDAFGIQPDDEIHGVKVETRPNGTEINIMPTMYTTMLTDPASGTNDLIGAITKYYRMACNYENKKKVAPQLNLLDSLITNAGSIRQKGFTKPAASSKLADAVHTYIGYHIYGRRDILPEVTLKGYKISLDKVFEYFSRWGRDIGLSWNLRSAISGGVSAWSFYANDAFVRKHYNMHDFTIANGILTKELISLKAASQFGKNQANNKLIGALEYNGLTFNQEEDLSNTNRWRIGRMITRAVEPYSAFKLMSFLPNSAFTVSVYLNYKLIRLEDGQLHFISENDFLDNHFLNKSIEERKAIYRNAKDNLWNAYEMKDGFRVKSKYAPYVTAELEEEITAKLGSISSHAEGMVEEADKSGVHLLPALSTILMFRAFIPKNIENTISPMYWNYQTKELSMGTASAYFYGWKYGSDRKLIKLLRVLTGRNDEKLKELQEQYPDVDIKKQIDLHIRRFNAQIFTYFFWLTIFNLFGMGADDDDYWFTQFLRLELKKISLESGSRYNAMDVFDILNSITPLIQTFVDVNRVINPLSYLSSRKYEEIERGAYKGLKGWQRDFIKVIPILNAYYNMKNPREKLNDMINRIG